MSLPRILLALSCLCCLAPRATLAQDPASEVRVGVTANYPPLVFRKDGEIRGLEPDFAAGLERRLGVPFRLVELPWNELIPALLDQHIDVIMSGMSITPDRQEQVHFTASYLRAGQMVLVRSGDARRLAEPASWESPQVGVGFERGTTGESYARSRLAGARLVGFAGPGEGIAALRAESIDLFVHDAPTVWRTVGGGATPEAPLAGIYLPLTEEHLAWAIRPGDAATLGARLESALEGWRESGELELLLARWIPVRKVAVDPEGRIVRPEP